MGEKGDILISGINYNSIKAGIDYNYDYNVNLTEEVITIGDKSMTHFTLSTKYNLQSGFGQYIKSKTDEFGNETSYYNDIATGLVEAIRNAKGEDTHFIYDNKGNLIDVIRLDDYTEYDDANPVFNHRVKYQYDINNRLDKIILDDNYYYDPIFNIIISY